MGQTILNRTHVVENLTTRGVIKMETRIIYSRNEKGDEHDWQIFSLNILVKQVMTHRHESHGMVLLNQ